MLTLTADMLSGPIVAMVWEGRDVVKTGRSKFPFPAMPNICTTYRF